ncbi:MAG: ABC transporter substrate-binding protein [Candidatus Odyssella sp.]|nr:ABC transporter substrate-binding protein [Candidatus Odyssella sp.]
MMRLKRSGLVAALLLVTAPARAEDIVITQFGVAFAGNPFAIGIDGGYFRKAGVDLTGIIAGAGGGTSVRNVMASPLGYGEVVLSAAIAAIREGQDIRVVNVGARSVADVVVVVKPESPIKSLKDLEGKRIGFSNPKSLSEILAIMALEKGGLKAEQAQRVALGSLGGALTALEKDGVEAAITMQVVWAQRADKLRVILDAGRDLPPMVQSVGIATGDLMRKNPDKLRKIIAARREAVQFMNAKPEEAAKMLGKHFPKMPAEVLHKVTVQLAKNGYWSEGRLEREPMENMARGLRLVGDLKDDIDWSKVVDASFLPKDLQ